ncbi:MAG TPA: DUF1501 domain-containing protein [Gammaproteobacteria bacterium]|nr:DUF1501 domain-containing protein [Gammaproteobacteria bacterium]
MMNRRQFVKGIFAASAGCAGFISGGIHGPLFRYAHAETRKTLVVIFQRGGCDGLNTCIPYRETRYYELRPTVAVPPPKASDATSALDLDGFFGFHPGLASLQPIFNAGNLAVLPAVHYPESSRSHFDSQYFIESAANRRRLDGWLNRHLNSLPNTPQLRSVAFAEIMPQSLRGKAPVSLFKELREFKFNIDRKIETKMIENLQAFNLPTPGETRPYRTWLHQTGRALLNDMELVYSLSEQKYKPSKTAAYPDTLYGRQLQQTAQLIKANVGLEVVTLDINGWDTHAGQGNGEATSRHYLKLKEFADGIAALYTDLGEKMNDVVIMSYTEFGRTAKENASHGTDHGNACTWFLAGKSVNGGIHGEWPGLENDQLFRGRYLDFTIDYRDIMGDILTHHLGNEQLDYLLPKHNYSPLGLFNG